MWQYGYNAVDTFSTDVDCVKSSVLTNNFISIYGIVITLTTMCGNMVQMLCTKFMQYQGPPETAPG